MGFQTVVTARHVIDKMRLHFGGTLERVDVRVNRKDGSAQILPLSGDHWHNHPDDKIDVAVCGTKIRPNVFDVLHISVKDEMILTPQIIEERNIGAGDECM